MSKYKTILPLQSAEILSQYLLNFSSTELTGLFEEIQTNEKIISTNCLHHLKDFVAQKQSIIKNLGIDFPILFENPGKPLLVIVAMDPKRNDSLNIPNGSIMLSSVFALQNETNRASKKNDYWKFIEPLTNNYSVYLTDLYKLYYDSNNPEQKISNKDSDFKKFTISLDNKSINLHRAILEKELNMVFSNYGATSKLVIALGKESGGALRELYEIKGSNDDLMIENNGINFLFMPHVSRTVTQSIPTISNLFSAIGILKNWHKQDGTGDEFIKAGNIIKGLNNKLFI
jgi:hypothetical protein